MQDFIRLHETFLPPGSAGSGIEAERVAYDAFCAAHNPPRPPGVESVGDTVAGPGGPIPVRIYRATAGTPRGTVLYLHGGGFVMGGLDSHDFFAALLAARTPFVVVAVAYRLAPEHPYPAARDDARAVLRRLQEDPEILGARAGPLVVGGDSAGACLAASLALYNRDRGGPSLAGQFLVYPALAAEPCGPAAETEARAPLLGADEVRAFYRTWHAGTPPPEDPCAFPLSASDFSGLPPAILLPAEHDPLRDDAVEYARRLREHDVEAALYMGAGLVHGYLRALGRSPGTDAQVERLLGWLRARVH